MSPKYYRAEEDLAAGSHVGAKDGNKLVSHDNPEKGVLYLGVLTEAVSAGKKVHRDSVVPIEDYLAPAKRIGSKEASTVLSQKKPKSTESGEKEVEEPEEEQKEDSDTFSWLPWR